MTFGLITVGLKLGISSDTVYKNVIKLNIVSGMSLDRIDVEVFFSSCQ